MGCQHGREAMCFDSEGQHSLVPLFLRCELNTVIEVKVTNTVLRGNRDFSSVHVILVTVHDGPDGLTAQRPAASENAEATGRVIGLPAWAGKKGCYAALYRGHSSRRFSVPLRYAVPDAPNILPAFPAHSVEKGKLKVIGFVAGPAMRDIDHVPGLQPLVFIDLAGKTEFILAPGHHVPSQALLRGSLFRLESQGMANVVGG